jgi:hypothetical protein
MVWDSVLPQKAKHSMLEHYYLQIFAWHDHGAVPRRIEAGDQ